MVTRGTALKVGAVLLLLVGAGVGAYLYQLGSDFQQPTVESVESEFGAVEGDTTEIRTRLVLDNPNDQSIPGAARLGFAVTMNGVPVADGSKGGVGLRPGRNELNVTVPLRNEQIPAWWVTHVNNDERTELVTAPSVSLPGLPVSVDLPNRTRTIETDLLGAVTSEGERTVAVGNTSVMTVSNQRASWGEATAEETPLEVRTDIENVHDYPVRLDGTAYTIEMNGVVVGNGTTDDSFVLQPGESGTFAANPVIDTPRMADWWASHVAANETTRLSVRVYGLVEQDGELERVPITVFEREAELRTDLLGEGVPRWRASTRAPTSSPTSSRRSSPPPAAGARSGRRRPK
ncbi:hypothetical protein [Halosegnis marinus]|uniref:hypothetical protein n=1 Tax=Halosegnis marinus TaxID=3034023 RepID=UPI003613A2BC